MGYYSDVDGALYFSEPVDPVDRGAVLSAIKRDVYNSWIVEMAHDEGYFTDGSIRFQVDGSKVYSLEDEVKTLVRVLRLAKVTVNGTVTVLGEEQPDVWRLRVLDSVVTKETARLVWPDGTEYRR